MALCNMTTGYNDRTCTNGKGGIKSVLFFPVGNISSSTITANEVTALTVTGEVFLYKLKSNLSDFNTPEVYSDPSFTCRPSPNPRATYVPSAFSTIAHTSF